jgi:hypothetical protein
MTHDPQRRPFHQPGCPHSNGTALLDERKRLSYLFSWWKVPQRVYGGMLGFVSARTIKDFIIKDVFPPSRVRMSAALVVFLVFRRRQVWRVFRRLVPAPPE